MTSKAMQALTAIATGDVHLVSWQMTRHLDAQHLIDFDPRLGWHLTALGWDSLPANAFTNS